MPDKKNEVWDEESLYAKRDDYLEDDRREED